MSALGLQRVNADGTVQQNFDRIEQAWPPEREYRGHGDPNTIVTAGPGAQYVDVDTGQRWTHEDPALSNTSWMVK